MSILLQILVQIPSRIIVSAKYSNFVPPAFYIWHYIDIYLPIAPDPTVYWLERCVSKAAGLLNRCWLSLCRGWKSKLLHSFFPPTNTSQSSTIFIFILISMQLGGIVRPHDGQCRMNNIERDSDGDVGYQDWEILVKCRNESNISQC